MDSAFQKRQTPVPWKEFGGEPGVQGIQTSGKATPQPCRGLCQIAVNECKQFVRQAKQASFKGLAPLFYLPAGLLAHSRYSGNLANRHRERKLKPG